MRFTVEECQAMLPMAANEKWKEGVWDTEPFRKGNVSLVFFAPRGTDYQTFHDEDEFYFIIQGSGKINIGLATYPFEPGDAFFVPARVQHRFTEFSENLAAWAVFF